MKTNKLCELKQLLIYLMEINCHRKKPTLINPQPIKYNSVLVKNGLQKNATCGSLVLQLKNNHGVIRLLPKNHEARVSIRFEMSPHRHSILWQYFSFCQKMYKEKI